MGVPVFFKWLSTRNPKILLDANEPQQQAPYSSNPKIDNFYIDMNGLIHPACNPKGQNIKEPKDFEQQIANVYAYIDKLMNIIRPKKLLYMAIDGVAPRAKMNQQRSRRFRAAMQSANIEDEKKKLYQKFKNEGIHDEELENYINKKSFDSNVITPGTQFLSQVCKRLNSYIHDRLESHPFWQNLTVVFSDANCPGQGQHKIMEFIRQQRASEKYCDYQTHCIYGADADLIMLTLATHQPLFYVIREVVITANDKWCTKCGKKGHYFLDCGTNLAKSIDDEMRVNQQTNAQAINVEFQFIKIQMVRQYIHLHYNKATMNFPYDLQRIIDDFVFLCFFVGNDFLPHVPCLSIRDGGIDVLMKVYQYCLVEMKDYLTFCGQVNSQSLAIFLNQISQFQDSLIQEMMIKQSQNKNRQNFNKQRNQANQKSSKSKKSTKQQAVIYKETPMQLFKDELKKITNQQMNTDDYSAFDHDVFMYKEKYYREKFRILPLDFMEFKYNINKAYMEALRWICHYYYKGVASWSWFYPFHYSPFFSDMKVTKNDQFQLAKPFKPFEQLLAVFPQKTASAVPKGIQKLMLDIDSPIADYFPKAFVIDIIGKKFAWLGEVLLPFIDDQRVLSALGNYEQQLTEQQKYRNRLGRDLVFTNRYGDLGRKISSFLKVGSSMIVTHSQNKLLEGQLELKKQSSSTLQYYFTQPSGRIHSIQVKNKSFNSLEELDDEYYVQTDKKGFGGQRFVRVIERVLARNKNKPFPYQKPIQKGDNEVTPTHRFIDKNEKNIIDYRERSRNKRVQEYAQRATRRDYNNEQYRSNSPENRRRDNQQRYNYKKRQ